MEKRSYEYQNLDPGSISRGELEIGDKVTPIKELTSNKGEYRLLPGELYNVKSFLPNTNPYKGGFVIDFKGQDWGLWFGKEGGADNMTKVIMSRENKIEEEHGDLLYKVLGVINESKIISIDDLVETVINTKMVVSPEKIKKVKVNIIKAINALQTESMIDTARYLEKGKKLYMITDKGRKYLRG
jgi:hypothetical protein